MNRRLPPLHLLRVFDAAGRHQSFKHAAGELHITPSAVSHQVKALERELGFALFLRANRRLELTDAGRAYLAVVEKAFARLRDGTERVLRDYASASLRINLMSALGRHVVIPRLDSFQERVPGVRLHIETSEQLVDFRTSDVDVAVRYGLGDWPGLTSEKLLDLEAAPVCSPAFARGLDAGKREALLGQRLIHMAFFPHGWSLWARAAGYGEATGDKALWFDTYDACIQAAEQGLGLALALLPLEQALLDSGRLVAPVAPRVALPQKVFLVCREQDRERREIRAFRDWLMEQFDSPNSARRR